MKTNIKAANERRTHEGAVAHPINAEQELRRSVMACLLWEDTFYESGEDIATRIASLVPKVPAAKVSEIAVEAREKSKLRHIPLYIVREMARAGGDHRRLVGSTLERVIQRADELTEFLAIYWKDGRCPLASQVKKGLRKAFLKFNAYDLAKYDRDEKVKLRDVMFLAHVKPTDAKGYGRVARKEKIEHELTPGEWLLKQVCDRTLPVPDTWEVGLSSGADKAETFRRLMAEKKLGALAFLRNLRNMTEAGIALPELAAHSATVKVDRVLPFRFVAAAKAVPRCEGFLEPMMFRCLEGREKLGGKTVLIIDNSGSMYGAAKVSAKSDLDRSDAACALAMLLREVCEDVEIVAFSDRPALVPPRRGFALRDAIQKATDHGSTMTALALAAAAQLSPTRVVVVTDEQSHQAIGGPPEFARGRGYFVNVSVHKNGIGYGPWTHIDGWSESIIDYVQAAESAPVPTGAV